jgi:hypothetical protein
MRMALVRRIRGVVLDVDGEPAVQATVGLVRPGSEGRLAEDVEQVLTDEDGKFEFSPAQEGEWRVQAENAPEYDYELHRPITRNAARIVRISRRETEPVEIRLAPPFGLDVSTDWGDAEDPAAVHPKISIGPGAMDLQPVYKFAAVRDAKRIEGLVPGRYVFPATVLSAPGYYLAALLLDGRDVLGQVVELTGPGSLKAVLRTGGGSVRGKVDKCGGGSVALVGPSDRMFWSFCNADGAFMIGDLPPGEYLVGMSQAAPLGGLGAPSPELKSALAVSGQRVKVEAGATATVELK